MTTTTTWGQKRKMRAYEIVYGILYDGACLEPGLALMWQVIANARRMMLKCRSMEEATKRVVASRIAKKG